MARERAAMPVFKQTAGGEDEWIFLVGHFYGGYVFYIVKFAPATPEGFRGQKRRAWMFVIPYRCLDALLFDAPIFHSGILRHHTAHLFEHFGGRLVPPEGALRTAQPLFDTSGKIADDLPIGACLTARLQCLAHALDPAVGVGERAFLFRPGSGGGKKRGLETGFVCEKMRSRQRHPLLDHLARVGEDVSRADLVLSPT